MRNLLSPAVELSTLSFHGYDIKFSPHRYNIIAVAASENFGIQGCGALIIYNLNTINSLTVSKYTSGLSSLAWSENNPDLILTCSLDGFIQTWNLQNLQEPDRNLRCHECEISSVSYCHTNPHIFSSSSWDSTIKLWNINTENPIVNLTSHRLLVYEASWSKGFSNRLASVSGDGTIIWDPLRTPIPIMSYPSKEGVEVLTCHWSNSDILAVATTDCYVTAWDLRNNSNPIFNKKCHNQPVRKLRFSPILPYEFVTVSYDFTTKLWNLSQDDPLNSSIEHHTEFVCGVDYDRVTPGRIADCSWDKTVNVYHIKPILNEPITIPQNKTNFLNLAKNSNISSPFYSNNIISKL